MDAAKREKVKVDVYIRDLVVQNLPEDKYVLS